MEHIGLPKHVSDWMETIEKSVIDHPDVCREHIKLVEEYAKKTGSDYLKGYCLFFRGFLSYINARLEESMVLLTEALNLLIVGENWKLATKTYNAMGNIADYQGDTSLAIDCYLKGLYMSREHNLPKDEYDICSNIGNVYSSLDDPKNAVRVLMECERIKNSGADIAVVSEAILEANLTLCYIQMGEYDRASDRLERLKKLTESTNSNMDRLSINMLSAELYHACGDIEKRDEAIKRLNEAEFRSMDVFDALNELCRHAMLLLNIDKLEEFVTLVTQIETLADSPTVAKQVLELWLSYYEKVGDEVNYAKKAVQYYKVARQRDEERNKIASHNITTRMHLEEEANRRKEVEMSNLLLKQKSERDALTGMNNRYKLNEIAELSFHKAYLNGSPLTFEILDIDCYKEFNDNYGHQAGDECLVRIAEAIRSLEEYAGVYTARYGGDEFVIIYEDYSKQDVEKMARRLKDMIYNLNIRHDHSRVSDRVTISQGLFHRIPSGGNKVWDFLYGADMALYGVKNRTRNSYYVGTSFEEVRDYSKKETP